MRLSSDFLLRIMPLTLQWFLALDEIQTWVDWLNTLGSSHQAGAWFSVDKLQFRKE